MLNVFHIFRICFVVTLLSATQVFGLEISKCNKLIKFKDISEQVDLAIEDYSYYFSSLVMVHSGIFRTIELMCPNLVDEVFEWKKGIVVAHLMQSFPSNEIINEFEFRECLISHFYAWEIPSNDTLIYFSGKLDLMLPVYKNILKQNKEIVIENKISVSEDMLCEQTFALRERDNSGALTQLGQQIQKIEQDAKAGILRANKIIASYCQNNKCNHVSNQ